MAIDKKHLKDMENLAKSILEAQGTDFTEWQYNKFQKVVLDNASVLQKALQRQSSNTHSIQSTGT